MFTIFFIYLVDEKIQNQFEWDMSYERDKQVITTTCLLWF